MRRRHFLLSLAALWASCKSPSPTKDTSVAPTPERAPEPPPWEAPGSLDESSFAWSLQAGDVTDRSVLLSFRSLPSSVELLILEGQGSEWLEFSRQTVERTDESWQQKVEGLKADTVYAWVLVDPSTGNHSRVGRFRTEPLERRILRFGATSCLGGNEPWSNLSFAASEQFDFFLLLGDTVYADGALLLEDYRQFWRHALSVEGLKALCASCSLVATWDDHEVGNNWHRDTLAEGQYEAALQAYRESLPQQNGPNGGIWRLLHYGADLDLFVLDCRSERTDTLYLSVEQMDWLKENLSQSKARFKIILNSVPINDYTDMLGGTMESDRWQGYPEQRTEILSHIVENGIEGVLWISGDVHHAMINHPDPPGGLAADQWEVAAGPSGSKLNILAEMYEDTDGHYPVLFAAWNYTRFTLDPATGDCLVAFIGDDGSVLASMSLSL